MNLQEFVKNVLVEINAAVDEARQLTSRDIRFSDNGTARTVEFDVAVSAEATSAKSGKAGIKVLQFAEAGGDISQENKNSTVSRITFGVRIEPRTKEEEAADHAAVMQHNANARNSFPTH
jgi:hypothetical protein